MMPTFKPTDTLYVYALKAPVWEFKFGDLLAKYVSDLIIYSSESETVTELPIHGYLFSAAQQLEITKRDN